MAGEEQLFDSLDPKVLMEHFAEQNEALTKQVGELTEQLTTAGALEESQAAEILTLKKRVAKLQQSLKWDTDPLWGDTE